MKKVLSIVCLLALVATCLFAFASCGAPNEDPAEAKKALEDNEYTIMNNIELAGVATAYFAANVVDIETSVGASKGEDSVVIFYFKDEAKAESAFADFEKAVENARKLAEGQGKEFNMEYDISGKMIWIGTPDAISDAK